MIRPRKARYRRGETTAFSKRIYVGRGPQTFDENPWQL